MDTITAPVSYPVAPPPRVTVRYVACPQLVDGTDYYVVWLAGCIYGGAHPTHATAQALADRINAAPQWEYEEYLAVTARERAEALAGCGEAL